MAVLLIPTTSDPFYEQVTNLDGTDYVLRFKYNQRENCWYLTVGLPDGTDLVRGIKLVCHWPLLRRFTDERLPLGELVVISNTDDDSPPGLEELGEDLRTELTYFSREEFDAL